MNKFYVYEGVVDGTRRYIGKGKGARKDSHMRIVRSIARRRAAGETVRTTHFYNRLTKAWLGGAEIIFNVLIDKLSEEEAYATEVEMIAAATAGQLWNILAGGNGMSSEEAKALWTLERKQELSKVSLKRWGDEEFKARIKAINSTLDAILQRAESASKSWTPERRKAHAKTIEDKWNNAEYASKVKAGGKARWAEPEYKEKMTIIAKDRGSNPTFRAKMKAINKERGSSLEFLAKMKPILDANRVKANSAEILARRQARFADPEYVSKHAEAVRTGLAKGKEARATPEYRAMRAIVNKDAWDKRKAIDPEYAAKRGAAIRAGWAKRKARLAAEHQDSQTIH